jgi:uncharacterized phage protein (TIGR01671 family)
MREILFRGKRPHYESWVEGFYIHAPSGRLGKNEHLIQTVKKDGRLDILYEVYPETVGQFTGLVDKNGKRIFDGDIVAIQSGTVFEMVGRVVFDEGAFQVVDPDDTYECLWYKQHEMEVLGNIHDKPGTSERR